MRDFLKFVVASFLGVLLAGGLLFLGGIFFMFLMISIAPGTPQIKESTVLTLGLGAPVQDYAPDDAYPVLDLQGFRLVQPVGQDDLLSAIRSAATDTRISGIYLHPSMVSASVSTVSAVREALSDFRKSGKFVLAYSDSYTQKAYFLASVADSVWLNPAGTFLMTGMMSEVFFYKDALRKLGVEVQVFRHGTFKSAVEPYIAEEMSDESRLQTSRIVHRVWAQVSRAIAADRHLQVEDLNRWIDDLSLTGAEASVQKGLVDELLYADQVRQRLASRVGADDPEEVHLLSLEQYALAVKQARKPGGGQEQIAVVYAEGDISPDVGSVLGGRTIQPEVYVSLLRKLRKDSAVKAVVLRVNSPGGSALSAEQIWREVELTSRVKPVVASFGAVAASGGYFIAAPARYILAEPASITGSIGVFMLLPQVETLMKDKLGIRSEVVGTHRHVDAQTIFRPLDAQEQAVLQQEVEVTYRRFVQHVADGRHMTYARVDSLAEGRVWAAEDALELGLVDTLGGLRDAIVKAATLSGTEKYQVRSYPGNIQSMGDLLSGLMQSVRHESAQEMLGPYYQVWKDLTYLSAPEGVQARLPFHIHLY